MSSEIITRRALASDSEFIVESNTAMALETEGLALDPDVVRPGVAAVLADGALGFYLVAEIDGRPAGQLMVTYEWSDWRNGLFWWIQSVYVRPEFRRRGVYRALHRQVAVASQAAGGVCGIRLYVEQDNTIAQQVYESLDMHRTRYQMYEVEF
jgi:ribosomal protein S18 acetylase RimI-like enzyme